MIAEKPLRRRFYRIPVLGWIARDVIEGDRDNIWYLAVILFTLWVFAIAQWGLAAVALPFILLGALGVLGLVILTLD